MFVYYIRLEFSKSYHQIIQKGL